MRVGFGLCSYIYYGPGPHWGTVRKKCPQVRYVSHVYYAVYILILYIMIIISRSLSRWHSFGSISNASTTWGRSSA